MFEFDLNVFLVGRVLLICNCCYSFVEVFFFCILDLNGMVKNLKLLRCCFCYEVGVVN